MKDKPDIMMMSEFICRLRSMLRLHGDLPVDLAVDYETYDDTRTARGPLDCDIYRCEARDWAKDIYPVRLLISSSGFLTNLRWIPE